MNKKVSFPERADLLKAAALNLRSVLDIVEAEAKAMTDARERLAAKRPAKRSANSAE
jgi:hypothetical protein